ncbi:MAG: hypothetical protein U5R48_14180 [Gammaproteobacteria bacterium]|nr:hypothetical protein [Gammaproteobacteria bacterium]
MTVGMGRRGEHTGLGRYLVIGWWQSSLELVPRQLSTLLAGALLGSTGAGLFQLARDVANVLARPALMLRQAALPDLARVWHAGGRSFVAATLRLSLVMAGPALALVALIAPVARPGLTAVFGPGYATAAPLLMLLLLAASLELAAAPLRAAAYAMGRPGWILTVQAVATIIYLALFIPLAQTWGLVGAGIAALALAAIFLGGLFVTVLRAPPTDAVLASPR